MKKRFLALLLFVFAGKLLAQETTGGDLRLEGRLRTWAEENVKWIICPAEREVYDRLRSDADRKAFIDAFWYRRDPDPQTALNEAKDEYYARVDFADGQFRENELRGSLTERGRIWIVFGPPERRDVHPRSGGKTFAWEAWHYDQIPYLRESLDLQFTDQAKSGEYRLTLGPEERDRLLALWECDKIMVYRLP